MFTKGKSPDPVPPPVMPKVLTSDQPKKGPVSRAGPSLISADVTMVGKIVSEGEIQIDGKIEGDVRAAALTIGDQGAVTGEIVAETVIVRGNVSGRIRGRKVTLCTGSKVRGDIIHASLAIEPNSIFEGQVKHSQDPMVEGAQPLALNPPEAASAPPA